MSDTADDRDRGDERHHPEWDDEYLDRVGDRLRSHYDLEKDVEAGGVRFTLYGELRVETKKHFLHPALAYARHESTEYLFVRRADRVGVPDLERLAALGHELADERVEADERHYRTDFTFVVLAGGIDDDVRTFVEGFRDRTLLSFGYHGHYEIHLVVVAPDLETSAASREADIESAFRLWEPLERRSSKGLLGRLF